VDRLALDQWLVSHPALRALYEAKESRHSLYRTRRYAPAKRALMALTDPLAAASLTELQTLHRTLMRWRHEILAYFATGLTNGRTEGFNDKAKVVKGALAGIGASTSDSDSKCVCLNGFSVAPTTK